MGGSDMAMTRTLLFSLAAAMTLSPGLAPPAGAGEQLVLSPSSEWHFQEFDDRCRASREFGAGEDRTTLWIEQGGIEANYNLTFLGRPLRNPYGNGVHIQFGDEPEFVRSYITAESSQGRPVLRMYGVTIDGPDEPQDEELDSAEAAAGIDMTRAGMIDRVKLRTSIAQPIELELGSMTVPFGFLGMCGAKLSDVLSEAGRALTGEASPPTAIDDGNWLSPADYPRYLVRYQIGAEIGVRLTVNARGKATSCIVTNSNRPQLFDDAVCLGLMKRAKFEPARNAKGKPVASYFSINIVFSVE
ncbi:MAG: TonB family protein [Erythrobacter sp.]